MATGDLTLPDGVVVTVEQITAILSSYFQRYTGRWLERRWSEDIIDSDGYLQEVFTVHGPYVVWHDDNCFESSSEESSENSSECELTEDHSLRVYDTVAQRFIEPKYVSEDGRIVFWQPLLAGTGRYIIRYWSGYASAAQVANDVTLADIQVQEDIVGVMNILASQIYQLVLNGSYEREADEAYSYATFAGLFGSTASGSIAAMLSSSLVWNQLLNLYVRY